MDLELGGELTETSVKQLAELLDKYVGTEHEVNDFGDGEWGITIFGLETQSEIALCSYSVDMVELQHKIDTIHDVVQDL